MEAEGEDSSGARRGWGAGGGGGPGRASGSGALEVLAEGQDAEHKISYSRETSLITAGGYSEGILWPAWDAHGKKKKKNPAFSHPGFRLFQEHQKQHVSLQAPTPCHRKVNTNLFLIFQSRTCSFITSSSRSTSLLCKRQ